MIVKKLILKALHSIGTLLRWKWLFFIAGIGLISSTQSCKPIVKHCYKPSFPENDSIIQPSCYDMPAPIDTNEVYETPVDSSKTE